jgi:hypothetical protein
MAQNRESSYGSGRIGAAKITAEHARQRAKQATREADRDQAYGMVGSDGGLRRARAAVSNHRPMPRRRPALARGGMQSLQGSGEPSAGRHPSTEEYTDLEAGRCAEMPVMSEGSLRAAGSHDQVDGDAGDHAVSVGASG